MFVDGRRKYTYNGPVLLFGKVVANSWSGTTWATSQAKAAQNIAYQYKKKNGLMKNTKVTLGKAPVYTS